MMKTKIQFKRNFIVCIVLCSFFLLTGCCSRYSYYSYKQKGEAALKAKNYKKAKNYFSIIYNNEKKSKNIDKEHITWAYYRLGVIAELTGDLKLAKGYYWGDSIDDKFYVGQKLTNWFAQSAWKRLDKNGKARSLDEILAFEKTRPSVEEEPVIERKKKVIIPQKRREVYQNKKVEPANSDGEVTYTVLDATIPPRPGTPKPFKIYR